MHLFYPSSFTPLQSLTSQFLTFAAEPCVFSSLPQVSLFQPSDSLRLAHLREGTLSPTCSMIFCRVQDPLITVVHDWEQVAIELEKLTPALLSKSSTSSKADLL